MTCRWVTLPCPFGNPQCSSKVCRNGITQSVHNDDDETALTQVQERMTNHVIATHNLEWQEASDLVM